MEKLTVVFFLLKRYLHVWSYPSVRSEESRLTVIKIAILRECMEKEGVTISFHFLEGGDKSCVRKQRGFQAFTLTAREVAF